LKEKLFPKRKEKERPSIGPDQNNKTKSHLTTPLELVAGERVWRKKFTWDRRCF